jgi:hypothetical protein
MVELPNLTHHLLMLMAETQCYLLLLPMVEAVVQQHIELVVLVLVEVLVLLLLEVLETLLQEQKTQPLHQNHF